MRIELNIPDDVLTPTRRNKYAQLFRGFQANPELIDAVSVSELVPRNSPKAAPLSNEELARLKELDGTFGLLEDVSDEVIDRIEAGIQFMKIEGFSARA